MTTMDLSRWFNRSYSTVRTWQLDGHEPWGPHGEESRRLLVVLEGAVKRKHGFPIPTKLSPRGRRAHIEKLRDELTNGVSKPRLTR